MADSERGELAEERTKLAEDRTVLAHERSFAGWMRTGMASVGIGLGFNALFHSLDPPWIPKAIACAFLAIAVFIFISAERRAHRIISRLETHRVAELRPMRIRLLAWMLSLATLTLAGAIWALVEP
jgi:putative membrane protein